MKEVVLAFIDRINAHDVAGLAELMSVNHMDPAWQYNLFVEGTRCGEGD